ncbi:MAG: pseudaminic acid cytidylyltransferase [Selenomonadaceae bacterium]|nr:pseudaminic acid cytidylyltransferase [Selenomonadaceae bacterium]
MSNVAIIPARGGSKRIPRKNIKDFCGQPIIAYSIKAALNSGIFDEVMVSTDADEIAVVAKKFGASVPFMRSAKTSDDFATTADVLNEVISEYDKRGRTFDWFACIYPTAPFVTSDKLRAAFERLQQSDADMLMPVVRFSYPPQRALVMHDGLLEYKWPENYPRRSQDLEPFYHDVGQFYFYRRSSFVAARSEEGTALKTIPMLMNEIEVQDIDNLSDWELAEIKFKMMLERAETI